MKKIVMSIIGGLLLCECVGLAFMVWYNKKIGFWQDLNKEATNEYEEI